MRLWFGLCALALVGSWRRSSWSEDGGLLALGALASLVLYAAVSIALAVPAWDRYALLCVPLCAFLFAWATRKVSSLMRGRQGDWLAVVVGLAMAIVMVRPAQEAARSMLPLGDTSYWDGIESVAAYVRGQVPGRATIVYRELGWHLRYYMAGFPQDFRWFQTGDDLLDIAHSASPCYILVAAGGPGAADLKALREAGFQLRLSYASYHQGGAPSLLLYRIEKGAH